MKPVRKLPLWAGVVQPHTKKTAPGAGNDGSLSETFAGATVFDVGNDELWANPRHKYVSEEDLGEHIREYCKSNPGQSIVLRDPQGAMVYLRRRLQEGFEVLDEDAFAAMINGRIKHQEMSISLMRARRALSKHAPHRKQFSQDIARRRKEIKHLSGGVNTLTKKRRK
jgi:hypothetical protein